MLNYVNLQHHKVGVFRSVYMNKYENMILGKNCGSKSIWQLMDRLAGKQSKTGNIPPIQTPNDSYAFTDSEKANCLMAFSVPFLQLMIQTPIFQNLLKEQIFL